MKPQLCPVFVFHCLCNSKSLHRNNLRPLTPLSCSFTVPLMITFPFLDYSLNPLRHAGIQSRHPASFTHTHTHKQTPSYFSVCTQRSLPTEGRLCGKIKHLVPSSLDVDKTHITSPPSDTPTTSLARCLQYV